MLHFRIRKFGWMLMLALGLWALVVQANENPYAHEYRYRYVPLPLSEFDLPPGLLIFDPVAINDSGRVYGTVLDDSFNNRVAVYEHGSLNVLSPGFATTVNARGAVGGGVCLENPCWTSQAALFDGNRVETVPPLPEEVGNWLYDLNDSNTALVGSWDAAGNETDLLYKHGKFTVLDFGPTVTYPWALHINNAGTVSGTTYASGNGRGFRFDPRSGKTTLLNPLPTEPDAWGLQINNRGDVLGYSFIGVKTERIGTWGRDAKFKTYFVEGTPEFPTISNRLLFNDNNLIVISDVSSPASELGNSYLVPKPGVRLNLAELVENLPPEQNLSFILDINNNGDMIGYSIKDYFILGSFLLERIGTHRSVPSVIANAKHTPASGAENGRHPIPAEVAALLRRHLPPLNALKSGTNLPKGPLETFLSQFPESEPPAR